MTTADGSLRVDVQRSAGFAIDCRLRCAPGELLALAGPSGSGKSTVLRLIAGLDRAERGRVAIGSSPLFDATARIDLPPERRRIGFVFQDYALFPHRDALGNLLLAMTHLPRRARRARAEALLAAVNLEGLADRRPAELSGGQRQRVALARALARDPAALLLDEPFSAVDQLTRRKLYRELGKLRRTLRIPMILVTHDIDEVMLLADSLAVMHRGRVLQRDAVGDVLARPASVGVARLIGHRNLLAATVLANDGDTVTLGLGGQKVRAAFGQASDGAGDALTDTGATRPPDEATQGPLPTVRYPARRLPDGVGAVGDPLALLVPDAAIVLHRHDRPSRGERENPLEALVRESIALGDVRSLRLALSSGARLGLRVSRHIAQRNGIETGSRIGLSLVTDELHAMPPDR